MMEQFKNTFTASEEKENSRENQEANIKSKYGKEIAALTVGMLSVDNAIKDEPEPEAPAL